MSEANDPSQWIERAEEDYSMARSALRRRRPFPNTACFLAQQCAEKYLKALLVSRNVEFPKVHDLLFITNLCENAGILVPIDLKQLNTLSTYAVRVRYPGNEPTLDEAREALEIARSVRRFSRSMLGAK